jgi:hypothetical protein
MTMSDREDGLTDSSNTQNASSDGGRKGYKPSERGYSPSKPTGSDGSGGNVLPNPPKGGTGESGSSPGDS